jgi:RNA polymerase sigma-70 factor (ECF subfamily)
MSVRPPDSLETLYREHAAVLFRFLTRLTGNEAEVKDILQEVFIRLAKSPRVLHGVHSPRSFLFRMAHRLAIDRARRDETRSRYADRAGQESQREAPSPAADPDEAWKQKRLFDSLAALPPEQRAVLLLKVWEDLTFAEIAETLEISPDTAASRYRYALNKLRDALRPLQEDLR